jgi:hypothetical protein
MSRPLFVRIDEATYLNLSLASDVSVENEVCRITVAGRSFVVAREFTKEVTLLVEDLRLAARKSGAD